MSKIEHGLQALVLFTFQDKEIAPGMRCDNFAATHLHCLAMTLLSIRKTCNKKVENAHPGLQWQCTRLMREYMQKDNGNKSVALYSYATYTCDFRTVCIHYRSGLLSNFEGYSYLNVCILQNVRIKTRN